MLCYGYYFRINTRYYYQNVSDGRTQWQYPVEESECTSSSPRMDTPPPPNISDQNTSHPEPVDMDIEEDNHKEDTEIIVVSDDWRMVFFFFVSSMSSNLYIFF